MLLQDKIKHLRLIEGQARGLGREMTKAEAIRAMEGELGQGISHAYMCQLESGSRRHMSPGMRDLLARFFKVHPGYLVSDPEGYQENLGAFTRGETGGAGRVSAIIDQLARRKDSDRYLVLFERLLEHPGLAERLYEVVKDMNSPAREDAGDGAVAAESGGQVKEEGTC
jgi:hypothetical protein